MQLRAILGYYAVRSLVASVSAKVVSYDWEATWVNAAPDGFTRPVVGINGQWPCPIIEADVGDTIEVRLTNSLGNETTGIHWHGIHQVSTSFMDGPSAVTQCPLPPDMTMTYRFVADYPGTYWYHSHNLGQYLDGLRGPLIVHDPKDPYHECYDEEYVITLSDWYHEQSIALVRDTLQPNNTEHTPPRPQSVIINDGLSADYNIVKGKTYRFRVMSYSALASFMFTMGELDMRVISMDAVPVAEKSVSQIRLAPAQRYDFLVTIGDGEEEENYPFLASLDQSPDYLDPDIPRPWNMNLTGQLVMDPQGEFTEAVVHSWEPYDDATFQPYKVELLPDADKTIVLDFEPCFDDNGVPRMCFNGSPYIDQEVPSLYTAASVGESNTDPSVYGPVHPFVVSYGNIVDIIVNNGDVAIHPFHLHGHQFQILTRAARSAGAWPGPGANGTPHINPEPPWRDTVEVMTHSYIHLRYEATNPGVYLFHCHIEWHVAMGLTATIIEAPERLRNLSIPEDHIEVCRAQGIQVAGNAAGNTLDVRDTSGFRETPSREYTGSLYLGGPKP